MESFSIKHRPYVHIHTNFLTTYLLQHITDFSSWCSTKFALIKNWISQLKKLIDDRFEAAHSYHPISTRLHAETSGYPQKPIGCALCSISWHLPPEKKAKQNNSTNKQQKTQQQLNPQRLQHTFCRYFQVEHVQVFHILNLSQVKMQTHLDKTWTFSSPLPEAALKKDSSQLCVVNQLIYTTEHMYQ